MNTLGDPNFYFALLGALVPLVSALAALYVHYKHRRSYFEQVERLVALLPDEDVDPTHASLKQRYSWAEALRQFDLLTLPRPQHGMALLFRALSLVTAVFAVGYLIMFLPNGTPLHSKILAVVFAAGMLVFSCIAWFIAGTFRHPVYRLAGRPLNEQSPHTPRIRQLRADYGLRTASDIAAERSTSKRMDQARRVRRWYRNRRYEVRLVALIARRPLATRARRVRRQRSPEGAS
ncbi:hypothetical protein QEN40_17385 [Gordonia alkanivorans]|uniref:hypothetical protein n=1 Tax=Gordonia alkanivorans TaxID=84096 RepID=UPI00244C8628|nr:hypothetical protein [Gordonia alkanivorans]MDH3017395.1 hypothetical protein [Gordonia alkanivorans]MDH3042745.1 hypothetical protein [Gordonia alkanivorans]